MKIIESATRDRMYSDIVIPNGNEIEFITFARALGYSRLFFCYEETNIAKMPDEIEMYKTQSSFIDKRDKPIEVHPICINRKIDMAKFKGLSMTKVDNTNIAKLDAFKSDIFYGFEHITNRDGMHQRLSGLNHVMAKELSTHNKRICFPLNELINLPGYSRAKVFGKISQNIMLLKKYNVEMIIASLASKPNEMRGRYDLMSLFITLGMDKKMAKSALSLKP